MRTFKRAWNSTYGAPVPRFNQDRSSDFGRNCVSSAHCTDYLISRFSAARCRTTQRKCQPICIELSELCQALTLPESALLSQRGLAGMRLPAGSRGRHCISGNSPLFIIATYVEELGSEPRVSNINNPPRAEVEGSRSRKAAAYACSHISTPTLPPRCLLKR